ncbi:hypothetical protein KK083_00745 [Fulvivirgaceae bacterium PWU4]|uniref:ABC transporter permease subunit n=1 Tax=Chryseosolibacter histidini TaxID=2782349 RepID=A0AAP2DFV4_9BACT|nr:hypothetical protein [Chryseosolibacter histidini]MBT1695381.1 hypothetical protein [Chryseosolibacter histidini]
MKFLEIFRFELSYQVQRVWTWLFFAALLGFSFLMTRDNALSEALYDDFFLNSPFAIAKTTVAGSLIWLLVTAVLAGDAAGRDVATGMHSLFYTAPISKAAYLGGRFFAAFVLNALILLAVQAGVLLGVYLPGVEAALIGPFRPAAYLTAYGFLALPNALVATAVQFGLATRAGRPMAAYLGSVLIFFMSYIVGLFLFLQGRQDLANLLDPIGVHFILSELSHLWTPTEKSWRLIALEGTVLTNRLLWLGVALATMALTYLRFRFAHRTESSWWKRWIRRRDQYTTRTDSFSAPADTSISQTLRSQDRRTFGFIMHVRQTLAIAWASFRTIATSWAGLAMLVAIPMLTVLVIIDQMEANGVPLLPTTLRVVSELTTTLSAEQSRWVIVPLLVVFFAGELVWREREAGLGEITDAMPGSEWAPFVGKFLGLGLVLTVFMALLTTAGILAQTMLDYHAFEIGLYLKILFGLQLPEYLLFTLLALAIHVVVDQKYIGHLVTIIVYVIIALAPMFGIEHNLLIYGAGPAWSYTEMQGFGASLGPWLWFKLYWVAWTLLLAVVAKLLWARGRQKGFKVRLRVARSRFTRATALTATVATMLILTLGGYIFYNTNVLNEYLTEADIEERSAAYELRYGRYAQIPQPQLTGTNLRVEIYPRRRAVEIRGSYHLVNHSAMTIDSIHVATVPGVETGTITFNRKVSLAVADQDLNHRIYALEHALQPGDSLQLAFEVNVEPHGFRENGVDAAVVANGTFFNVQDWLPAIGYQRDRELIRATDRRKYGLPARPLIASLYDAEAPKDRSAGIVFDAVIGTDDDQVAVAPGALLRTWTGPSEPAKNVVAGAAQNTASSPPASPHDQQDRRYFHYTTDGPIGTEWTIFSANYAVHEARWSPEQGEKSPVDSTQQVAIRIFHDPRHTAHLDRMMRSIRASLDYYTEHFGPYQYHQINVVERPGNGTGMHADPSMITHAEGFSHWKPNDDPNSLDLPYAVVAHEIAHQWTVPYATVEGAPVMSESVAWYYGMKVVEHARGVDQLKRLLSFMRQPYPYPPIRRGEPLLRGLDPYLSYRRGPFALYAVSEYIGEARVNTALRTMLKKHRPQNAPLATTLDLYSELKAVTPDSLHYLLHDLSEVNTYWELEATGATAKQTQTGNWQLTLHLQARKVVVDSAGMETEVAMDDWIEIGVFASASGDAQKKPLYLQKHHIRSGKQTLVLHMPEKPERAGIDPRQLLIDLETDNNTRKVDALNAKQE